MSETRESASLGSTGLQRISSGLIALCAAVASLRYAALRGWIPAPAVPWHLGDIAVWALGGFCILWGMERGMPAGEAPRPMLRLYRLGTFLAALVMLGVWVYA